MGWRSPLTAALLLAALLSGWLAWRDKPLPSPAAPIAQHSDYVLYNFDLVSLNSEGEEAFTLSAPQLRQTPGARTLDLTTPTFLIPQGGQRRWQVNANSGWISASNDEIRLRGEVIATPIDAADQTRIVTEALDVFPQQHLATSNAVVTLSRLGTTMHGSGMRAHLDQNRVELLSNVKIRHDPSSR